MTDAVSGMTGSLWIYTADTPASMVKLGELSDLKLKIDGNEIDTSNCDDDGWGSSIAGARKWELSASSNLIMTDACYALIIAALIGGSDLYAYILQSGTATSSPEGWEGACWVSSGNLTLAGINTQQKGDWTIKGRGALAAIP
ncbi:phage tail protein [Candidatus Pacearchaeota archaeon]|nr:phage tail protein [Candidatus Pacearchaeota archaeon]